MGCYLPYERYGIFCYTLLKDGSAQIEGLNREKDHTNYVVIPEKLGDIPVTAIKSVAERGPYRAMNRLEIPPTVTRLCTGAICSHRDLVCVNIPDSVRELPGNPFFYCPALKEIRISPTHPTLLFENGILTDKTRETFIYDLNARDMDHYTVPEGFRCIADGAFMGCRLKTVTLPGSLERIGERAFSSSGLRKICIPDRVTTLGSGLFAYCAELTEVSLPEGLQKLPDEIFLGCAALPEIHIPQQVMEIGKGAFRGCKKLTEIALPPQLKKIEEWTFYECRSLKSVVVPEGVTRICAHAFSWCNDLSRVVLPKGVKIIENGAFMACKGLRQITLPEALTFIGMSAFRDCSALERIEIPEKVHTIDEFAFHSCTALEEVVFRGRVKRLRWSIFDQCPRLRPESLPVPREKREDIACQLAAPPDDIPQGRPLEEPKKWRLIWNRIKQPLLIFLASAAVLGLTFLAIHYLGYKTTALIAIGMYFLFSILIPGTK